MSKVQWKGGTFIYPIPAVMVSCGTMEESNIITVGIPIIILAIILYVLVKVGPKGKAKRLNEEAQLRAEYKKAHENNRNYSNPEMTLFTIIELAGTTCFNSIIYNIPVSIEEYKPYLYKIIRNILKEDT